MEPVSQNDVNHLVFRKPWKSRIGSALFAMLLAGGYPLLLALTLPGSKMPMTLLGWFCFGILEVVCLPFAAFFLYLSGPEYLDLDLNRRTYRYVFGWPFLPQVQRGLWEDIAGVYVWDRNRGRLSGYSVGIAWKSNRMRSRLLGVRSPVLGTFDGLGRLDRANRMAEEITSLLGVSLVDPPFMKRSTRTLS